MTFERFTSRARETQIGVITGGHPFNPAAFFGMLDSVIYDDLGYNWSNVEHPAATAMIERPDSLAAFDCLIFYDVPGQDYRPPERPLRFTPSDAYRDGFETLLSRGMPMLFLHHAVIGWPEWPRYAEIIGGTVLAEPGMIGDREVSDSGYRADVTHRVIPVADHPITAGLEEGFEIFDQLYMGEVFESTLTPLMRSDYPFDTKHFYSINAAMAGRPGSNDGWDRAPGNNLMVWTRQERESPIVYIQCGDGPEAYACAGMQRLLRNAIGWLAEPSGERER